MNLEAMKAEALDKVSQGDVNLYRLPLRITEPLMESKDPVLVYGDTGNHHKLVGGKFTIGEHATGVKFVDVAEDSEITHQQHQPPIALPKGFYLVDRAREVGVLDDLVGPVAD